MTSRRSVLSSVLAVSAAGVLPAASDRNRRPAFDILRTPDYAAAYAADGVIPLSRSGSRWTTAGISVITEPTGTGLPVLVSATGIAPIRIHLRWKVAVSGDPLVLGDAWERSYGDLAWRSIVPERVLPWYFLVSDHGATDGYGVKTQAASLCFWQLDPDGVSLWLDVSNGGAGVRLGDRELHAATVVTRTGTNHETSVEAASAFCRLMCEHPRLLKSALYGSNDWYYAYGKNSAESVLRDARLMSELSDSQVVRPYTIIDMGWKEGSATFPSMAGLAKQIAALKVRPGLWIRPLEATAETPSNLLLPDARFGKITERARELAFDPTIPEALAFVTAKVTDAASWGYELVKHDFSTYDLLGKWGREMGPEPTSAGWHLYDRTRTNAEVILDLYKSLRAAAGENRALLGCNTVGHLGAGVFEAQRTGDDTSGREWERTRRMGVNTLAFRLPQHNTFFAVDPDCVGITAAIPWELNRQWLELVAGAGVALFVSPGPDATGGPQRAALREAFARVNATAPRLVPKDWFRNTTPESWERISSESGKTAEKVFGWSDVSGVSPFDL